MKRKQFVKGVEQIAQEGAIQIFKEPNSGMERVIVGVVGVLQLEVLEYRLKNEYNVDVIRNDLPYQYIRWVKNRDIDIKKLNKQIGEIVAREQVLRDEIDKIIAEIEG